MIMKKILLLWIAFAMTFVAEAKDIYLDNSVRFSTTDKYESTSNPNALWTGLHKGGSSFVMVKTVDVELNAENRGVAQQILDEGLFNLSNAELIETETEHWLDWTQSYVLKYYSMPDSKKIATYSFTSFAAPYSFLCQYETDEELADFKELISTITEPELKGKAQIILIYKNSWGSIALVGIALLILATILGRIMSRGGAILICTLVAAIFLLFPLSGYWLTYFITLIAAFFWSILYSGEWYNR